MKIIWPIADLRQGDNQPGGVMIFSSIMSRAGYQSVVVPTNVPSVLSAAREGESILLAFSSVTAHFDHYLELSRKVKALRKVFSVFGGPHPTFFPDVIHKDGVDAICIGEGEDAFLELVTSLSEGRPVDKIQNLHVKIDGRVVQNPLRPLVHDLDSIPVPDHTIFERAIPKTLWRAPVRTSRGCPYRCSYCFNDTYRTMYRGKGSWIRRRSVNHVLEELEAIKASKRYEFVRFNDDIFTLQPDWIEEFSRRYKRIGIPFSCIIRANYLEESLIRWLAEAGCYSMTLGVEAANDRVRNEILQRDMTREEIIRACDLVRRYGIKLGTLNIVGIPGSTLEDDLETLDLNLRCRPHYSSSLMLQPYRGTVIYEYARVHNYLAGDPASLSIDKVNMFSCIKFRSQKEKRRIENFHKIFLIVALLPILRPFVNFLIRLPLLRIYYWIYCRMFNYQDYFISTPARIGLRNAFKRSKLYSFLRG